ncbi:NTP pyrophosphatase (Non-canonical NTP hydrolase) [Stackebrandtia soli]
MAIAYIEALTYLNQRARVDRRDGLAVRQATVDRYAAGVSVSLEELTLMLREFAAEREWEPFHTPKNLAMAVSGEAGELAAELQWSTPEESNELDAAARERVADEMADVLHYLVRMADVLDIDLIAAAMDKLARNRERFPVGEPETRRARPRR